MKRHKMVFKIAETKKTNAPLHDKRLSWKARGMLLYLTSLPEGTETSISEFAALAPDGRDSVRAGFDELGEAGYIVASNDSKRRSGVVYLVYGHMGWGTSGKDKDNGIY